MESKKMMEAKNFMQTKNSMDDEFDVSLKTMKSKNLPKTEI